jgi:hypothetical protein
MKIKKVDRRYKGYGDFDFYIDPPKNGDKNFFLMREWCWETFGASKEIEVWQDHKRRYQTTNNSHNEKWVWQVDDWTNRIYLRSSKEANWFTLKWI